MAYLVALTTSLEPEGGGYGKPRVAVYTNYLQVLNRVGLTPVLVSQAHDAQGVEALVGLSGGLVLSGGEDIEPSRYGEEAIPGLYDVNPGRDAMEWRAVDAALANGLPILGICRGHQLLNVYFGGTLYQDLPTQYPNAVNHWEGGPWGEHHHEVQCMEGSLLHDALAGCDPLEINSFHHQAIKDLAPGLRCTARADDGLIEAIESTEHDWVVGVQWHPERHEATASTDDPNIRIVAAFADRVKARQA